jgi:hypothetical protein
MTIVAALSSFLFTLIAYLFAVELCPDVQDTTILAISIASACLLSAFAHGIVFGRQRLRVLVLSSCAMLLLIWVPQVMYATITSLARSAAFLLLMLLCSYAMTKLGVVLRDVAIQRIPNPNRQPSVE